MSEILPFALDDYPELDKPVGAPVKITIEGKIVSRDANAVEVEVSSKDVQTEKAVDKEYKEMLKQPALESAQEQSGKDEVDW